MFPPSILSNTVKKHQYPHHNNNQLREMCQEYGFNTSQFKGQAHTKNIGKYKTPLFFPSEIELDYIKHYIEERAHKDFKGDDLNDVEGE